MRSKPTTEGILSKWLLAAGEQYTILLINFFVSERLSGEVSLYAPQSQNSSHGWPLVRLL